MVIALSFDIAIVGGSVAGLSAAREISKRCDANIVIIEEHKEIGKPLNSSGFTFADTVEKYELGKAVERYYTKVGWYSFLGSSATFRFSVPRLAVLDYSRTCSEILTKARKANLEIYGGTKAMSPEKKGEKMTIELKGANEGSVECDLLIDAAGSSFFSSRFFSFRTPLFYSNPYGYEFEHCDVPENLLDTISFFVGRSIGSGGGWFYPLTRSTCRFGIAEITQSPVFPRDRVERYYEYAKRNMHPFAEILRNATQRVREAGSIPAEPMKKLVSDNVMRVGDAAGHATPHMLEGIRPSIESATLCGKIAAEAYEKKDFSRRFLKEYEKAWHCQNKLLYLYLLSMAEVVFALDDREIEESVRSQVKREAYPESFLLGLRGWFKFPHSFAMSRPDTEYLDILRRFAYHYVKWLFE